MTLVPVDCASAETLVSKVKGADRLLAGFRSDKPADTDALFNAIVAVSHFAAANPNIKTLEINPLRVLERGKGVVAQARVVERDALVVSNGFFELAN